MMSLEIVYLVILFAGLVFISVVTRLVAKFLSSRSGREMSPKVKVPGILVGCGYFIVLVVVILGLFFYGLSRINY